MSKYVIALALILVVLQFFRPEKNISNDRTHDVSNNFAIPDSVESILTVACYDCHSNKTNYPWYAEVQPVAWWLNSHITEGKQHLNFSTFTSLRLANQYHKFEEIAEQVEEGDMPLPSYTYLGLHSGADLTDAQREMLTSWAKANMSSMKAQYPPDSLIRKRRP